MSYKFSRETIAKKIRNSPITEDGYYFCKEFPRLNKIKGNLSDKQYVIDRELFKNKLVFNNAEIEVYLDEEGHLFDIDKMIKKDIFIYNIIKNNLKNKLNKKIPRVTYTLGELIDTSIYMFNIKYPLN